MKRWHFWLGVAISAACIAFALKQVDDWGQFGRSFRDADYLYIVPTIAAYFLILFIRAIRWRYILNQCGRVSLRNTWNAILVCYMGNNVFPFRAGELMRVFLIGRTEPSVSYSSALATVVVERLFDFLVVLIALALVLLFISFPAGSEKLAATVRDFGAMTLLGALILFGFLFLLHLRTAFVLRLSRRLLSPLPERFSKTIIAALERFAAGLSIMSRPRAMLAVFGLSAVAWAVNLTPVYLSGLAFGVHINLVTTAFMTVVGAAAASIPAAPGFFGTFHVLNQQALVFALGLDPAIALSIAVVIHATYYFPVTLAGALVAWRQGYSLTKMREEEKVPS
jgi:hypothetical protein